MFRNVKAAIKHYFSSPKGEYARQMLEKYPGSTLEVSALPDSPSYDETPYCTVVDGLWVNTVGEYKDALANFTEAHGG